MANVSPHAPGMVGSRRPSASAARAPALGGLSPGENASACLWHLLVGRSVERMLSPRSPSNRLRATLVKSVCASPARDAFCRAAPSLRFPLRRFVRPLLVRSRDRSRPGLTLRALRSASACPPSPPESFSPPTKVLDAECTCSASAVSTNPRERLRAPSLGGPPPTPEGASRTDQPTSRRSQPRPPAVLRRRSASALLRRSGESLRPEVTVVLASASEDASAGPCARPRSAAIRHPSSPPVEHRGWVFLCLSPPARSRPAPESVRRDQVSSTDSATTDRSPSSHPPSFRPGATLGWEAPFQSASAGES